MSKETAAYQLCDLHDPVLKEMVENEDDLRDTCNVSLSLYHILPSMIHNPVFTRNETAGIQLTPSSASKPSSASNSSRFFPGTSPRTKKSRNCSRGRRLSRSRKRRIECVRVSIIWRRGRCGKRMPRYVLVYYQKGNVWTDFAWGACIVGDEVDSDIGQTGESLPKPTQGADVGSSFITITWLCWFLKRSASCIH